MASQVDMPGYLGNSCIYVQAAEAFYEDASQYDDQLTFDDMNLSRPILKVKCFSRKLNKVLLAQDITGLNLCPPHGGPVCWVQQSGNH